MTKKEDGTNLLTVSLFGVERDLVLGINGEHQALNALAVLGAVHAAGGDVELAINALAALRPVEGRGAPSLLTIRNKAFTLIDESYNANPASMVAAISTLAAQTGIGRRIAVLGEMRELGERSEELHLALADTLTRFHIDKVYAAGDLMKPMWQSLPAEMRGEWAPEAGELVECVAADIEVDDIIMAKGSNASRVSEFVRKLKEKASF